jgi:hypothetical protein
MDMYLSSYPVPKKMVDEGTQTFDFINNEAHTAKYSQKYVDIENHQPNRIPDPYMLSSTYHDYKRDMIKTLDVADNMSKNSLQKPISMYIPVSEVAKAKAPPKTSKVRTPARAHGSPKVRTPPRADSPSRTDSFLNLSSQVLKQTPQKTPKWTKADSFASESIISSTKSTIGVAKPLAIAEELLKSKVMTFFELECIKDPFDFELY